MKEIFRSLSLIVLLECCRAQWDFDYADRGRDWSRATPPDGWIGLNRCSEPENQSPVNLMEPIGSYGWAYGKALPAENDEIEIEYQDPKKGSEINWLMKNLILYVDQIQIDAGKSYFKTKYAQSIYKSPTSVFTPV